MHQVCATNTKIVSQRDHVAQQQQQQQRCVQDSCSCLDGLAVCTMGLLAPLPMVPPVSLHHVTAPQLAAERTSPADHISPQTSESCDLLAAADAAARKASACW